MIHHTVIYMHVIYRINKVISNITRININKFIALNNHTMTK